jgi:anti-sigma factor RsiW
MTGAPNREPTCQELAELVTEYLEGLLAPAQHALVDLHISGCPDCTLYIEQMRTTIAVARRIAADEIPPGVRDALLTAFRGWTGERS